LQRFYAANDRFDVDRANNSISLPPALTTTADGSYLLDITGINAQNFTLRMQPQNSMAGDKCGNLTLTNLGVKGISGTTATREECWK
jgi:type IV pilus assembly protein PilE